MKILIMLGIVIGAVALTMVGFTIYLTFQYRKMLKELRDEGFYD
jgi:hypothetical protein